MKNLIVIALAALILVSAAPQPAQSNMGLFATWWDGSDMNSGFGGGVKYKFRLIPLIGLDARVSYIGFSDADLADGSLYTIPLEAVGTLDFGIVYGGLALGYYIWGGNDLDSKDSVGGSILLGASLGLGGLGVFGELKYNLVSTELDGLGDKSADGFSLNLGVTF